MRFKGRGQKRREGYEAMPRINDPWDRWLEGEAEFRWEQPLTESQLSAARHSFQYLALQSR